MILLPLSSLRTVFLSLFTCWASAQPSPTNQLVVQQPERVQDVALLDGEFAGWNFGGSPLLEVGYQIGIYAEHRAASLIRVDMTGVTASYITGARLRVYKPLSFTQLRDIQVELHAVSAQFSGWREGNGFAETVAEGATWSGPSVDVTWHSGHAFHPLPPANTQLLGVQPAQADRGHWIEFQLPPPLVESWIRRPETNAGLLLTLHTPGGITPGWGDHAYLYASEHYSENRPALVLEGAGIRLVEPESLSGNPVYRLPDNLAETRRWLRSRARLAVFAREAGLDPAQSRVLHFYDSTVREEYILGRYQRPMGEHIRALEQALEREDAAAVKAALQSVREGLLVWEYLREVLWYTSGPLAEDIPLSALANIYANSMWGRLESRNVAAARQRAEARNEDPDQAVAGWTPLEGEALEDRKRLVVERVARHVEPNTAQLASLTAELNKLIDLEYEELRLFRHHLDETRRLLAEEDISHARLWHSFRLMFHHHETYLYYQSIFNAPRWALLNREAPLLPWARWVAHVGQRYLPRDER